MADKRTRSRTHMSAAERRGRSELARLMTQRGLLRGNLQQRHRTCGKLNCKCARGELHAGLYLVYSEGGRLQQRYVPKDWEPLIRQWVTDYQRARRLLEEISRLYVEKLRKRED